MFGMIAALPLEMKPRSAYGGYNIETTTEVTQAEFIPEAPKESIPEVTEEETTTQYSKYSSTTEVTQAEFIPEAPKESIPEVTEVETTTHYSSTSAQSFGYKGYRME